MAGAAMVIGSGLFVSTAQAAYTVTLVEQGTSVVATGSGTIDLTGLAPPVTTLITPRITPALGP